MQVLKALEKMLNYKSRQKQLYTKAETNQGFSFFFNPSGIFTEPSIFLKCKEWLNKLQKESSLSMICFLRFLTDVYLLNHWLPVIDYCPILGLSCLKFNILSGITQRILSKIINCFDDSLFIFFNQIKSNMLSIFWLFTTLYTILSDFLLHHNTSYLCETQCSISKYTWKPTQHNSYISVVKNQLVIFLFCCSQLIKARTCQDYF